MNSEKIIELVKQLKTADNAYYHNKPVISDEDYDKLYFKLKALNQAHQNQVASNYLNSIPERLTENTFNKVEHLKPVLSLDKVRTDDAVKKFLDEWNKSKAFQTDSFLVQHKEDGLSVILYFNTELPGQEYKPFVALTRGGGYEGKDITNSVYQFIGLDIDQILNKLNGQQLTVRGEAIIKDSDFAALNQNGEYMNSRNLASGTLMQKDPSIVGQRQMHLFTYTILDYQNGSDTFKQMDEKEEFTLLSDLGFEITVSRAFKANDIKGILNYIEYVDANRDKIDHAIDGLVIKPNITEQQKDEIGYNQHGPNFQVAYKFGSLEQTAKLADVKWQVSANGKLTPVGILEQSVFILGSEIKKASLASIQNIEQRDLMINDTVVVARSNDVIPQIRSSIKAKRDGTQIDIHTLIPKDAIRDGAILYLKNNVKSKEQLIQLWKHFVSKFAMNIDGLSLNTISSLADNNLINLNDFSSLWQIDKNDFINIDGLGEKRYDKLQSELVNAKSTKLSKVLIGLSIQGLGQKLSQLLAENIKDMTPYLNTSNLAVTKLIDAKKKALKQVIDKTSGYGQDAYRIIDELFKDDNLATLNKLVQIGGLKLIEPQKHNQIKDNKLNGANFVITGKTSIPRKQLGEIITNNGGIVQNGIRKDTNYLLSATTESTSSKFKKAKAQGVKIIDEVMFKQEFNLNY